MNQFRMYDLPVLNATTFYSYLHNTFWGFNCYIWSQLSTCKYESSACSTSVLLNSPLQFPVTTQWLPKNGQWHIPPLSVLHGQACQWAASACCLAPTLFHIITVTLLSGLAIAEQMVLWTWLTLHRHLSGGTISWALFLGALIMDLRAYHSLWAVIDADVYAAWAVSMCRKLYRFGCSGAQYTVLHHVQLQS